MEMPRPELSLGKRVGVGLGFWAVGLCGVAGAAEAIGETVGTKFGHYAAGINDDLPRAEILEGQLHEQQTAVWVDLATGALAIAAGAALTRGGQKLWSPSNCQNAHASI